MKMLSIIDRPYYYESGRSVPQFPQIFHVARQPFLHSFNRQVRFLFKDYFFRLKYTDRQTTEMPSVDFALKDFRVDFSEEFQITIEQYIRDIRWMKAYIDLFWKTCMKSCKLLIFTMSPMYLYSSFLIKKIKSSAGNVATWAHGGAFDSMKFFTLYVQAYKMTDYFLTYGKSKLKETCQSYNYPCGTDVEVGSNLMYRNQKNGHSNNSMALNDQGLYFAPIASQSFHSLPLAGWNAPLQFSGTKEIIDYFISSKSRRLIIKGLRGQVMHDELKSYIADCKWLCYTDVPTGEALALNPKSLLSG